MKFNWLIVLFVFFSLFTLQAHEGHSENSIKSLHGGVVKKTKSTFVEVVQEDGKFEIYITGHDYKSMANQKMLIKATAEIKGKKSPIELSLINDHYVVKSDFKNEKHFKLNINMKILEKEESASFALENQ